MRKTTVLLLGWALVGSAWAQVSQKNVQGNATIDAFWERFRAAVTKNDKTVVASLSQFPIGMPYGISNIKNNAQLIRCYREVFNGETNAVKCFRQARPKINPDNPKEFTVACKNAAGTEVVIYSFAFMRNGWKFNGLDNLNE